MAKEIKELNEISFNDSFLSLADVIEAKDVPIEITTFDRFVQEIGCKSYPDYKFDSWHIRKICQWVDEVMASESKSGVAALPRGHLKSTILGYLFSIYRFLTGFGDSLYVSYKEDLATYHMSNIKTAINQNPILNKFCKDMIPQSTSSIQYRIGNKIVRMYGSGIFAVKRGLHANGAVIVDDILGTVDNPLLLTELKNAETNFNQEIVPIPNKGCPLMVFGTAIDYTDLLFKLKTNPQFKCLWLSAINPDSEHEVLWEDRFDKKTLDVIKDKQGWKAFSTEYMLIPVLATNAYFSRDLFVKNRIINPELINFNVGSSNEGYWWKDCVTIGGYDIGQKGNPSHVSIFAIKDGGNKQQKLVQIHQKFLDGWEYTRQIQYLESVMDFFKVLKLYYDNTRSEFTDRTLPRNCTPLILGAKTGNTARSKSELATNFSKVVEQSKIELLDDERFLSQIFCVTNDLQAPDTPMGHGDSFISCMLAIGIFADFYDNQRSKAYSYMGDLRLILDPTSEEEAPRTNDTSMFKKPKEFICPICNSRFFELTPEGKKKCVKCNTNF